MRLLGIFRRNWAIRGALEQLADERPDIAPQVRQVLSHKGMFGACCDFIHQGAGLYVDDELALAGEDDNIFIQILRFIIDNREEIIEFIQMLVALFAVQPVPSDLQLKTMARAAAELWRTEHWPPLRSEDEAPGPGFSEKLFVQLAEIAERLTAVEVKLGTA